jgi:hypothetical protein
MKLRLGFGAALVVVLAGLWLAFARPTCLIGYSPSLGRNFSWTCAAD